MSDAEERMLLDDKNEDPTERNSRCTEEVTNVDLFSLLKTYMNDKLKGIEKTFSDTTDRKSEKLKMHLNSKAINYSLN